ncbi:MAG: hypothetical protein QXT53_07910 [Ignisphaera sp.]
MEYVYRPSDDIENLLEEALNPRLADPIKIILLYTYFEKVSANIIVASGERKLKASLCRLSSKKRINKALAILRKGGFLSEDEYKSIRRVVRSLRCLRNTFLHQVCESSCPSIDLEETLNMARLFSLRAKEYIDKVLNSWFVDSPKSL